jgi:isoamylase
MSMMRTTSTHAVRSGVSAPLGATVLPDGVNFGLFSKHAVLLELLLFDDENAKQAPERGGLPRISDEAG